MNMPKEKEEKGRNGRTTQEEIDVYHG